MYAPYYETYLAPNTPSITATAQASGAKYFTLAFLQSTGKGSCSLDWNGNSAQPLNYYASDIASLRAAGGDVIPSFGGYSADHGGTEIADSCTNVQSIAADYEQVITTLGVTRLDMDVESSSLNNTAGITRRNQAIALTEQWAAANGIPLQIQYTIPVEQYGLDPNGEAVLQSAVANSATVTSVNIMVFDYYIAKEGVVEMGTAAENAATNTHTQLASIFPGLTSAQLWNMEGMTLLPGIDDLRKKTEVTSEADAHDHAQLRPGQQHELPVDLGDPARQRRLPRHRRQQHLLRHHPEHLGLQPHPRTVHSLTKAAAGTSSPG